MGDSRASANLSIWLAAPLRFVGLAISRPLAPPCDPFFDQRQLGFWKRLSNAKRHVSFFQPCQRAGKAGSVLAPSDDDRAVPAATEKAERSLASIRSIFAHHVAIAAARGQQRRTLFFEKLAFADNGSGSSTEDPTRMRSTRLPLARRHLLNPGFE